MKSLEQLLQFNAARTGPKDNLKPCRPECRSKLKTSIEICVLERRLVRVVKTVRNPGNSLGVILMPIENKGVRSGSSVAVLAEESIPPELVILGDGLLDSFP